MYKQRELPEFSVTIIESLWWRGQAERTPSLIFLRGFFYVTFLLLFEKYDEKQSRILREINYNISQCCQFIYILYKYL